MTPGSAWGHLLAAWLPELILSIGALIVLLSGVFGRRSTLPVTFTWITLVWTSFSLTIVPTPGPAFGGLVVLDTLSLLFRWLALGTITLVVLMASSSDEVDGGWTGEYLSLLLMVGVGLMLMAESAHLLMAYLSIELVSLNSYVLVALLRDRRGAEASL